MPDQPMPDQPMPDQPMPDQPMPDQPMPDQPMPDQPMPDQLLDRLAAHLDGALIASDFDGTLAPLVNDPSQSRPADGAVQILTELARTGSQIAIVTGRDARTALQLSGLHDVPGLVISGLHGAELLRDGELRTSEEPAGISRLRTELPPILAATDEQVWLEDKRLSLVVHTRRAADPEQALADLTPAVTAHSERAGLQVHPGHLVLEIRVPGLSKADAITELLGADTTAALYAGDDYGDQPAMHAVMEWSARTGRPALVVAVGGLAALGEFADVQVADPAALVALLSRLSSMR